MFDEAVLWAEGPEADDSVDGGWSKACEFEGEGDPEDVCLSIDRPGFPFWVSYSTFCAPK